MGGNDSSKILEAVKKGDEDGVRRLLKKGGDPNYRSSYLCVEDVTVLMVASCKGHPGIVRLLLESSAGVNKTDQFGQTPLHWGAMPGNDETAQLLLQHDADPNTQDMTGQTPLHWGAMDGNDGTVRVLLQHNADPNIQEKYGDTPLHEAAYRRHDGVVQILLQHKANPDIKDKAGEYPHDKAFGDLRQRLRTYWEEYRLAPLLNLGTFSLKSVKSYVVGSSRAGKTTFARAVTGLGDASNVLERTPGIDILEADMEEVGRLKVHDVAGHDLFHTMHVFFFGGVSALFEYVVDTDLSRDEMLADAVYWLSFIISGRVPGGLPVYILILGSRGGDRHQRARQVKLDGVTRQLMKKFEGRFIFVLGEKSLVVDMRQAGSKEMEEVKKQLAIGAQKCLERVTNVPLVCHEVQAKVLSPLRDEKAAQTCGQFTDKSDFHTLVVKEIDAMKNPSLYESLLYYLEEWGEIVDVGSRFVINSLWLCRSLLAAVLSSKADPESAEFQVRMKAEADGTATLEDIAAVLEDFRQLNGTPAVDPRAGIDILCHMGLAFPTERKDVYRFPALIQDSKPEGVWMKPQSTPAEPHSMVYVGIRLQCQSDIEIFSPAVMPLLQAEAAKQRSEMAVIMWKGGMLVQRISQPKVEALVVVSDKRRAIRALDLISRGPTQHRKDVKQLLDKFQQITMHILDQKSPGTRVERRYLSHQQISQHVENPISYSQEEVDLAKKGNGILVKETGKEIITDSVIDLLAIDDDHMMYELQSVAEDASVNEVIEAVVKHGSDQWYEIGLALGLTRATIKGTTHQIPNYPGKLRDIIETKRQQAGNEDLKNDLIQVCFKIDAPIGRAVLDELLKLKKASQK